MYQLTLSLWRTCVPFVVAFLVVEAARLGIRLDDASVTSALVTGFGTVYYAAFRYLEHRFGARWGWFLGAARPPSYPQPGPAPVPGPAPAPGPEQPVPAPSPAPSPSPSPGPSSGRPAPAPAPAGPVAVPRPDDRNLPEGG
ncbi:hypothetical protein ACFCX4_27735 [Kitasatospora sp. NPDC056327]|uniref:hypothetical protein n=1 Tax=Kitasatospora sp. NPDC056327 TaxID=3345785 RepID=UPI0035DDB456